jgi:hypothetical protein
MPAKIINFLIRNLPKRNTTLKRNLYRAHDKILAAIESGVLLDRYGLRSDKIADWLKSGGLTNKEIAALLFESIIKLEADMCFHGQPPIPGVPE